MHVVCSPRQKGHHPPYELHLGQRSNAWEVPERMHRIRGALRAAGIGPIVEAQPHPLEQVTAVHAADYLEFLRQANQIPLIDPESRGLAAEILFPSIWPYDNRWPIRAHSVVAQTGRYCFDTYTPILAETCEAALAAANCALTGVDLLRAGEGLVMALCRPPGHHAMREKCGGYCYLNNAAIAAQRLAASGPVAILDVDYHHGNGTRSIFYDSDRVLYVSIHGGLQHAYPFFSGYADERGAGSGYNLNLPLPAGSGDAQYLAALEMALAAVAEFAPQWLVLSLGSDTCRGDPICDFCLTPPFFGHMAARIAALGRPALLVTEGGYDVSAVDQLAVSFLQSWEAHTAAP